MTQLTEVISGTLFSLLSFAVVVAAVVLAAAIGRFALLRILFVNQLKKEHGKGLVHLLVKVHPDNDKKEDAMENFLLSLHHLLPEGELVSFEMVSQDQFLHFYLTVPKSFVDSAQSQLYAQYPDAEIEAVSDPFPDNPAGLAFRRLGFKASSLRPLYTYKDSQENLLRNLSALLLKAEPGERVYFQLILEKVGNNPLRRGFRASLFELKKSPGSSPTQEKLAKDLFRGQFRLAYQAASSAVAKAKLESLANFLTGIKGSYNRLSRKHALFGHEVSQPAMSARLFQSGDLWSTAEIATLYHFPYKGTLASNVVQTTSKRAPAPDVLPLPGSVPDEQISIFGQTNFRNEKKIFGIKRVDRRRHLYVVGKTGSGKSKLIELLLISDITANQGCCLLDPHGDLATEILKYIPKNRVNDVVYVDPTDREFPVGFNPLEPVGDYEMRQHLSTFFIAIFKKLFAVNWNPQMEHLIRYITLALLETPDANVLGITRILSDTKYRQRVIQQIQDPVVKNFWVNEFATSNERLAAGAIIPIQNKVGQFISNPIIRDMVGQRKSSLHFDEFMNEGKIVILNISKGKLGEDNSALLGSMFITKIQQAALARANIPEDQRRDFYFYVDEFQNFATDAFAGILSEARKYRLNLAIAHQYISQLPEDVKATVFGNVGSVISFGVGANDATFLSKEFAPVFAPEDMIGLNLREMYVKMSIDGRSTAPFSARTIDLPRPGADYSAEIINHSRLTYGKSKVSVDNEISRWTSATETIAQVEDSNQFPEPLI